MESPRFLTSTRILWEEKKSIKKESKTRARKTYKPGPNRPL
jgi:hypothetical protein